MASPINGQREELCNKIIDNIKDLDLGDVLKENSTVFIDSFKQSCGILEDEEIRQIDIRNSFSRNINLNKEALVSMGKDRGILFIEAQKVLTATENLSYVYRRKLTELGDGLLLSLSNESLLVTSVLHLTQHARVRAGLRSGD